MNVDPRCHQPIVHATAGQGAILASQANLAYTAQPLPAPPAPAVPALRINFAIAVCLACSLLILLVGPEFNSI